MDASLDRLSRNIASDINSELQRTGILFRIFKRAKSKDSIEKKLQVKNYEKDPGGKKMQDIIGIRIVVYFKDDLPLVYKAIKSRFHFDNETIDNANESVFEPQRVNLVFKMNSSHSDEVRAVIDNNLIDTTYEVQLRTIFSEGWHEVEHDLRYKYPNDWSNQKELSRTLNGIYASLETNDWSILSLFDKLGYEHYRASNLAPMLRSKFRIRFIGGKVDKSLEELIITKGLLKDIYRIDRLDFLNNILDDRLKFPFTMDNLLFVINAYYLKDTDIDELTPDFLLNKNKILKNL